MNDSDEVKSKEQPLSEMASISTSSRQMEEDEVYDRQIRLWGAEAQAKMATCKVLYIHMTGLSSEILKNLVLAGVRAVVCDNRPYPDAVMETPSFFLPRVEETKTEEAEGFPRKRQRLYKTVAEAMQQSIEELNPLLEECSIVQEDVENLPTEFFEDFEIVVASRINMSVTTRIIQALQRSQKKGKFFMADCFGLYGACCIDLGMEHMYRKEIGKTLMPPEVISPYVPLAEVFKVPLADVVNRFHKLPPPVWERYRSILEYVEQKNKWPSRENDNEFTDVVTEWITKTSPSLLEKPESLFSNPQSLKELAFLSTAEVAPVCAVLGGLVSNEVIKAISGKGEPANNVILLDALKCKTLSFLVKPTKAN